MRGLVPMTCKKGCGAQLRDVEVTPLHAINTDITGVVSFFFNFLLLSQSSATRSHISMTYKGSCPLPVMRIDVV